MSKKRIKALALYSGGLDSIVSCRVIMVQGIEVTAVRYVTPFFGYDLLARENEYVAETRKKYGIDVVLRDLSDKYLKMLRNPAHGYGKNFNPCVDCKILIAGETRSMLEESGASFIISGEVIGQRPMSQRRDTLRVIERESGCEDLLLRPLCAKNLLPTLPERTGLVDREALYGFSGRTRAPQMALAASFGIADYPSPAGGCVLTDPALAERIASYYEKTPEVSTSDMMLLLVGRQFKLAAGGWLIMGRDEVENGRVLALGEPGDILLRSESWPGPSALLRNATEHTDIETAAGLVIRFSKKGGGRSEARVSMQRVTAEGNTEREALEVEALSDEKYQEISEAKP